MWEYQAEFKHPIVDIMKESVESFIGEDIELVNRLLAQHCKHNSRRSDARLADDAYRCLGMMVHDGMEFNNDLLKSRKLTKGNRRYNLKLNGPEVKRMRSYIEAVYDTFANGEWKHYAIPKKGVRKRGKKGSRATVQPMDPNDHTTMVFSSMKTGTEEAEAEAMELIDVRFVASVDWYANLKKKWNSLVRRKWKFREHLSDAQLERLERELPQYVAKDYVPESKAERKKRGQKRKQLDEMDVMYV